MREGDVITGAALTLDPAARRSLLRDVKALPAVAGVALREVTLAELPRDDGREHEPEIFINLIFAGIIAFGVVYNAARVSLSERSRELASLRVLGFTRAEISLILLGELAVLTVAALPVGAVIGYRLGALIMSRLQQRGVPALVHVVAGRPSPGRSSSSSPAPVVPALIVRRRLDRLDLVARSLKIGASDASMLPCPADRIVRVLDRRSVRSSSAACWRWRCGRRPSPVEVGAVVARAAGGDDRRGRETRVRERFVVSAPVAGRVLRIELEPGDRGEARTGRGARARRSAAAARRADARRSAGGRRERAGGARPGARRRAARAGDARPARSAS